MIHISILIIIYLTALIGFSFYLYKKENREDFLIAGRNRNMWQIAASKFAGSFGAAWLISYTGYAYVYGSNMMFLLLGLIVGYPLFAFWAAPKIHKFSAENKFYTIGDFVSFCTGEKFSGRIVNIISVIVNSMWLIVSMVGGAKIISYFGYGLSYEIGLILTSSVTLIYILLAGYKGVIYTDILQAIMIIALMAFITVGLLQGNNIPEILESHSKGVNLPTLMGFLLYGCTVVFSSADRYQLCFSAKNSSTIKKAMFAAIFPMLIMASFLLLIGLYVRSLDVGLDSGIVFLTAITQYLPAGLMPFAVVMLLASIMSSLDTQLFAISSHIAINNIQAESIRARVRLTLTATIAIASIVGYFFRDVVQLSVIAAATSLILSVPMMYLLFGNKNINRFISSIIGAIIGFAIGWATLGIEPVLVLVILSIALIGLLNPYNIAPKIIKNKEA